MTYTVHGHHIPGSPKDDFNTPTRIARCGGLGLCNDCSKQAIRFIMQKDRDFTPLPWVIENTCSCIADEQIHKLANFIMSSVPGEPSRSESAVDVAIRLIREHILKADPND